MTLSKLYSVFRLIISLIAAGFLLYLGVTTKEENSTFFITTVIFSIFILGDATWRFRKSKETILKK